MASCVPWGARVHNTPLALGCLPMSLGVSEFRAAVEQGNEVTVSDMLRGDVSLLSSRLKQGKTCWHLAAEKGHANVLRALQNVASVQAGAMERLNGRLLEPEGVFVIQLRLAVYGGWTPLMFASYNGHVEAVKLLIQLDPGSLWVADDTGKMAVHIAARAGHTAVLEELLSQPPPPPIEFCIHCKYVDAIDHHAWTPLHYASFHAHIPAVACLLSHGADTLAPIVSSMYKGTSLLSGMTALHLASQVGSWHIIRLLLQSYFENGADLMPSVNGMMDATLRSQRMLNSPDPRRVLTADVATKQLPYDTARRQGHLHLLEWLHPNAHLVPLFRGVIAEGDDARLYISPVPRLIMLASAALHQLLMSQLDEAEKVLQLDEPEKGLQLDDPEKMLQQQQRQEATSGRGTLSPSPHVVAHVRVNPSCHHAPAGAVRQGPSCPHAPAGLTGHDPSFLHGAPTVEVRPQLGSSLLDVDPICQSAYVDVGPSCQSANVDGPQDGRVSTETWRRQAPNNRGLQGGPSCLLTLPPEMSDPSFVREPPLFRSSFNGFHRCRPPSQDLEGRLCLQRLRRSYDGSMGNSLFLLEVVDEDELGRKKRVTFLSHLKIGLKRMTAKVVPVHASACLSRPSKSELNNNNGSRSRSNNNSNNKIDKNNGKGKNNDKEKDKDKDKATIPMTADSAHEDEQAGQIGDGDGDGCPVCLDAAPNVVALSCGHGLCIECARDLCTCHRLAPAPCPYCRTLVGGFKAVQKVQAV